MELVSDTYDGPVFAPDHRLQAIAIAYLARGEEASPSGATAKALREAGSHLYADVAAHGGPLPAWATLAGGVA